jgi:hypothetical protein
LGAGRTKDQGTARTAEGGTGQEANPLESEGKAKVPHAFYSPDELRGVPFDQVDEARIPEAARPYLPIVKAQLTKVREYENTLKRREFELYQREQALSGQSRQQTQAQQPQAQAQQPQQTQSQAQRPLAAQAQAAAEKQLGIGAGEFDVYLPEHLAAFTEALQGLKAGAETAGGVRGGTSRDEPDFKAPQSNDLTFAQWSAERDLVEMDREMRAMPDAEAFNAWGAGVLQQMPARVREIVHGSLARGDVTPVRRIMAALREKWAEQRAPQSGAKQIPVPAVEGSGGISTVSKRLDLKAFSEMDDDEQAQALKGFI